MLSTRITTYNSYIISKKTQLSPQKLISSIHSLQRIKKIVYEHNTKVLELHYFEDDVPEIISNVDEFVYERVMYDVISEKIK